MLSINQELVAIDEAIDEVAQSFLNLSLVAEYKEKKSDFLSDLELQERINEFQVLKEDYDSIKAFAPYRSDLSQLRRQLFSRKREIDLNPKVIAYRQAEVALQEVLAKLTSSLTEVISTSIFVDTGLPLASHKPIHGKGRGENIREKESDV